MVLEWESEKVLIVVGVNQIRNFFHSSYLTDENLRSVEQIKLIGLTFSMPIIVILKTE